MRTSTSLREMCTTLLGLGPARCDGTALRRAGRAIEPGVRAKVSRGRVFEGPGEEKSGRSCAFVPCSCGGSCMQRPVRECVYVLNIYIYTKHIYIHIYIYSGSEIGVGPHPLPMILSQLEHADAFLPVEWLGLHGATAQRRQIR